MKKAVILLVLYSALIFAQQQGSFTDPRDGRKYKTVKIGKQTWMAENLNYAASGSRCYKDVSTYCEEYGGLYNWEMATKACPKGWHLPSNAEWDALYHYADGTTGTISPYHSNTAGKQLKAANGWNWNLDKDISGNGADRYGFAALPGGFGIAGDYSVFYNVGLYGYWWSASKNKDDDESAYSRHIRNRSESAFHWSDIKETLFSVRCVKD